MKCLCCNKPLKTDSEIHDGWHQKCIRTFFGTNDIPSLSLDQKLLHDLADRTVNQGLTVPGVQKKLSLHLNQDAKGARFTLVDYPTGFILKPQSPDYTQLPEAEHLTMTMARATGIFVVPFAMMECDGKFAYITKRIDRFAHAKLAMEDFCQLSGRSTSDKYKGSYEECGKIIKKYSGRSGLDLSELFLRLVFCNVTGNSDMHLKNFSLIETERKSRNYVLSPAYDLLPVNVIMPADKEFSALTLNGKKRNLRRNDFLALAENMGLQKKAAIQIMESVLKKQTAYEKLIDESYVTNDFKDQFKYLMHQRMQLLS